jgi:hypothetical protein
MTSLAESIDPAMASIKFVINTRRVARRSGSPLTCH